MNGIFALDSIIFILIYFIVFSILLASMYLRRANLSDYLKALVIAVVVRALILIVSLIVSAIGTVFYINLGALELGILAGYWSSFILAKFFWEEKIVFTKLVNMTLLALIITIPIFNIVMQIISSLL